jgi:uracil phosphoribosyltransferase
VYTAVRVRLHERRPPCAPAGHARRPGGGDRARGDIARRDIETDRLAPGQWHNDLSVSCMGTRRAHQSFVRAELGSRWANLPNQTRCWPSFRRQCRFPVSLDFVNRCSQSHCSSQSTNTVYEGACGTGRISLLSFDSMHRTGQLKWRRGCASVAAAWPAAAQQATSAGSCISDYHPNAELLSSRALTVLFTTIRDKHTTQCEYVSCSDRLMNILAEEGLARLATPSAVETPCGSFNGLAPAPTSAVCGVDIVRSGGILLEAVRKIAPDSKTAKVLIQRCEETAEPTLYYAKLPAEIGSCHVLLCDPMLATGGSALMAIEVLREAGVEDKNILFLNVLSCPEGLQKLADHAPGVRILTAALDAGLNEQNFIVPGLGDYGDRYYGTAGYREGLWGTDGH